MYDFQNLNEIPIDSYPLYINATYDGVYRTNFTESPFILTISGCETTVSADLSNQIVT